MAGAGKGRGQNELKNKAMLVVRNITKQEVTNVIFPNGITIGTASGPFKNGFRVHGNARVSGVVNAQGFKVNGQDLSFSTTPTIIVTSETDSFTYGSRNPNESPTPSNTEIFITQLGQSTTITAASITVQDASGRTTNTTVGSLVFQSELTPGNSYSAFTLTPLTGTNAPTYPLTVTVTHEGITTTKVINEVIEPVQSGDFRISFIGKSTSAFPGSTITQDNLYYPNDSPLTGVGVAALTGFAYTDGGGQLTGILNIGNVFSGGMTGSPQDFTFGSSAAARANQMFYRPSPTDGTVTIHRVRGSLSLTASGASSSDTVSFVLALYRIDYSHTRAVLEHTFSNTVEITGDGTNTMDLSTSEITPFDITNDDGDSLFFALWTKAATGGYPTSSGPTVSITLQGFLEYSKGA